MECFILHMNPVRTLVRDLGVQTLPFFFKRNQVKKNNHENILFLALVFSKKRYYFEKKGTKRYRFEKKVAFDTY